MENPKNFYEHGIGLSLPSYIEGMRQLDDFLSLLYHCLKEVLPDVRPKKCAGFGWRGYKLEHSAVLPAGQYYFQIYLGNPTNLIFMESYINGVYTYPFSVQLDLLEAGFYDLAPDGQKQVVLNCLREALAEATRWQQSPLRIKIVPTKSQEMKS